MKKLAKEGAHVHMSPEEITQWFTTLKEEFNLHLKHQDVKLPKKDSAKMLWLTYLRKYIEILVHKDTISTFCQSINPALGQDQQVRHIATDGWYVLNKGDIIPNTNEVVPAGYHILITVKEPKPSFILKKLKRAARISAKNFEELKATYDYRCATCGSKEAKPHFLEPDKRTELQQGHMNPHIKLTIENTIPQCQLCNQVYKDYYVFDEKGRVSSVASLKPIEKADKNVKEEIKKYLDKDLG